VLGGSLFIGAPVWLHIGADQAAAGADYARAILARSRGLSIFSARREIISHVFMQVRLVGIPTPATAGVDRNVVCRIEMEGLEPLVALSIPAMVKVAMPEVKQIAIQKCRFSSNHPMEGLSPSHEMRLLPVIHSVKVDRMVEAAIGGGCQRADRTPDDGAIVYSVPFE
jgi:hypothetical protein